ncbi:MAG: hypothetical protein OXG81_13455 [Acidobacteria bacterium]|nr:hypothetical protein [Acidobacteriota bacterium]
MAGIRSGSASRATDPPFGPGRLCLATPAVEPCGPSSPFRGSPGLPPVLPPLRVFRSGLRLPGRPSGSGGRKVHAAVPLCVQSPGLRLGTDHVAARRRGDSLASLSFDLAPLGYFVARLVGSHDEAPEASADEALQLPIGLPLLPGNVRPVASLKPPPWLWRGEACASLCRPPGSLRLREPLAD